jgi:hypothetical protein
MYDAVLGEALGRVISVEEEEQQLQLFSQHE